MPAIGAGSAIGSKLKTLAAVEAISWVKAVSKIALDDKEKERAFELASEEYSVARYASKIVVADKARELLRFVNQAIRTGVIPARFDGEDRLGELITTGLGRYDPRIAFQATLRTAYAAGREERIERDEGTTHKVYRTMRDSRVRNTHRVLDGVCLPKGDKFWNLHSAPNGWRCRCLCYGVDQDGIDRLARAGVKLQREAPEEKLFKHTNKATGETETLPASVEPGWGFKPGTAQGAEQLAKILKARMQILVDGED
jgi:hypothetical protein